LTEIRLERPFTARLEGLEALERLEDALLHQVRRVRDIAGPAWQPSCGPTAQQRNLTRKQLVERVAVARARPRQQSDGVVRFGRV
jgi:hypothetical protein